MKNLTLNFYQRFKTADVLSVQTGTLGQRVLYADILRKVRLTGEEVEGGHLTHAGAVVQWKLPTPEFGTRIFSLENQEAEVLAVLYENDTRFTTDDAEWQQQAIEQLRAPVQRISA